MGRILTAVANGGVRTVSGGSKPASHKNTLVEQATIGVTIAIVTSLSRRGVALKEIRDVVLRSNSLLDVIASQYFDRVFSSVDNDHLVAVIKPLN